MQNNQTIKLGEYGEITIRLRDDAKFYTISQANRVAVTAKWLWERDTEIPAYIFSDSNFEMGLDPWTEIQGMDASVDGSEIILWIGRTGEKKVSPDYEVYVNRRHAAVTEEESGK